MQNEFPQIISLIYIVLLAFVFFLKKKPKSIQNRIYSYLVISNIFGLFFDILAFFTSSYMKESIVAVITCKLLLVYFCVFIFIMTLYIYIISHGVEKYDERGQIVLNSDELKKYKVNQMVARVVLFISIIFIFINKISIVYIENGLYTEGIPVSVTYVISSFAIIMWIIWMITHINRIKSKEFLPVFAYMFLSIFVIFIQYNYPWLLLLVPLESFVTLFMYFTLENPDMRLIEQLNVAKDAADRANNAKTDFLSSMSHEIRTPLNAIVGFSNGLLEQDLNDQTKDDVNNIITASNNLLELVNGILDISKIEAGKLEIIETNYSFDKMYNELIVLTKTRIGEKPIEFRYNKDASMPEYFYGDGNRLKQIVLNLLTNAAKYTNKGFIEFNVSYVKVNEKARFIISVSDTGLGISKENLEKLFTKFERLNVEKNTTVEGTGLGLAITKNLIEMMGGKILVDSEEGKGSKFTVIVEQSITPIEEVNKIKSEEEANKVSTSTIDAKGKKVLIVDDNSLNLKVAERLLKKYDIDTETCLSGYECLDKVSLGKKYDLILMDDMMPKMNGQETFKKLKNDGNFNTPVVILTANAISGMKEQYLSFGFDDYLSKPIEKPELERVINKYLIK